MLWRIFSAVVDTNPLPHHGAATQGDIKTVLSIIFGITGAVAVLYIVIGGFRYIYSRSEPQETAKARQTIIYALVGMFVSILAVSIVQLIAGRVR